MSKVPDNIRLQELVVIANLNKPFFDDFLNFLQTQGYTELYLFVSELDASKAKQTIWLYLECHIPENLNLYDGIARPYPENKAKWLLLG
jgi:hypothetical protein